MENLNETERTVYSQTEGGLHLFTTYIETSFEVGKLASVNSKKKFKVFWSERYQNYVLSIWTQLYGSWERENFSPLYYLQKVWKMSKEEVLEFVMDDFEIDVELKNTSDDE